MAVSLKISGKKREITGSRTAVLRRAGVIPAVLYGHKVEENVLLAVDKKEFEKTFKQAGENTLVELDVEQGAPHTVLVHDVQHDVLSGEIIHVDFYQVDLSEKITASVPLEFIGESNAVKELGGTLTKNMTEVKVEALPGDLPHSIVVDIGKLASFEDAVTLADLKVDIEKVKVEGTADMIIAKVQPPRSEEELKALDETVAEEKVAEVEGVEKPAEGEAAPAEGEESKPEGVKTKDESKDKKAGE